MVSHSGLAAEERYKTCENTPGEYPAESATKVKTTRKIARPKTSTSQQKRLWDWVVPPTPMLWCLALPQPLFKMSNNIQISATTLGAEGPQ